MNISDIIRLCRAGNVSKFHPSDLNSLLFLPECPYMWSNYCFDFINVMILTVCLLDLTSDLSFPGLTL